MTRLSRKLKDAAARLVSAPVEGRQSRCISGAFADDGEFLEFDVVHIGHFTDKGLYFEEKIEPKRGKR